MREKLEGESYYHPTALVQSTDIGSGTTIWAFVNILKGAIIGSDCNICDHVFIENDVTIGDRVTIKCGVQLWDGLVVEDDVFIGPNATFTNDKFPRSKQYPDKFSNTVIKNGASVGANATILPGLSIGKNAMVGAGAVVTSTVPPNAIVVGNPARIVGYVDTPTKESEALAIENRSGSTAVEGVDLFELNHVTDLRGDLCVAEIENDLPFIPKRVFFVYNVPNSRVRGEHVHRELHEYLVCVSGSVSVVVDDGKQREEHVLDKPWVGLHLPPRVWRSLFKFSSDAVLMVFASHEYDPDDYIRDYDTFLEFVGQ